jgi:phosphinothricin acetyltransferase
MQKEDWLAVASIYKDGIDAHIATFHNDIPSYEEWDKSHINTCRFVAVEDDMVVGWTALTPYSGRCAYSGVAELSIYIKNEYRGKHIGERLLQATIEESEKEGFWTLQSSIIEINKASIALHTKAGFRMVGYRERIAKDHFGVWQNTVLMERRSTLLM